MRAKLNQIQGGPVPGTTNDPYSTLSYAQSKGISNHNFGDIEHGQVFVAQSQCGALTFGDNYHAKVLSDDGFSDFKDFSSFDQTKKDKYDTLTRELMYSRLIIINSLSSKDAYIPQRTVCW